MKDLKITGIPTLNLNKEGRFELRRPSRIPSSLRSLYLNCRHKSTNGGGWSLR